MPDVFEQFFREALTKRASVGPPSDTVPPENNQSSRTKPLRLCENKNHLQKMKDVSDLNEK